MYFLISPLTNTAASPLPYRVFLQSRRAPRKGISLLVVVTMLGLFAIVGVGFVIYAQSEATGARFAKEAKTMQRPTAEAEVAFHFFMNQLLYDVPSDAAGVQSVLRSHSMASTMLDYNPLGIGMSSPYSGTGRLHYTHPVVAGNMLSGINEHLLVNYQYYKGDGFVRDPGFSPLLADLRQKPQDPLNPAKFHGGLNASYTYPDLNNLFVAAVNAKGEILIPSFHRDWTGIGPLDPSNPKWAANPALINPAVAGSDPLLKYKTMRPLPAYHTVGAKSFALPEDGGGDVKNWHFGPGVPIPGQPGKYYNHDSIWMDLGAPVLVGPDGVKYKMLFAPLIVPLDGKLNLNVHGTINKSTGDHASNQGWGPWEVNIAKAIAMAGGKDANEWKNLIKARYGADGLPSSSGGSASGPSTKMPPPFFVPVDFDGAAGATYLLPSESTTLADKYFAFPKYNGARYGNGNAAERLDHPAQFNPFSPTGDDTPYHAGDLEALYRYLDTGSPSLSSAIFKMGPINLAPGGGSKIPLLFTPHSADINFPGGTPWLHSSAVGPYQLIAGPLQFPMGTPVGSPWAAGAAPLSPNVGEFGLFNRSITAGLGQRLDLNRTLGDYFDPFDPGNPTATPPVLPVYDPAIGSIDLSIVAVDAQFHAAETARQLMAKQLFDRLVLVTMGLRPGDTWPDKNVAAEKPAYDALRWLAQLAVNIVDYRDEDDIITVFRWDDNPNNFSDPGTFVYGTELPRVVLNEIYAEMAHFPNQNGNGPAPTVQPATPAAFDMSFWIELHNPLAQDAGLVNGGTARLQTKASATVPSYPVYKLSIVKKLPGVASATNLRDPANTIGKPDANEVVLELDDFTRVAGDTNTKDSFIVAPANGSYVGTPGDNVGYYVLGPQLPFPGLPEGANPPPGQPSLEPTLRVAQPAPKKGLTYKLPSAEGLPGLGVGNEAMRPKHTVLLQRLANPYIPPQPDPSKEHYNPYITVDYQDDVKTNVGASQDAATPPNIVGDTFAARKATGRKQTYVGDASLSVDQQPVPANMVQPQHTFFRQNGQGATGPLTDPTTGQVIDQTLALPFAWLVHLDRQLISPMELLHVSSFPPHLLTQQFKVAVGGLQYQHMAPWFTENARIYRLLEFVEAKSRIAGLQGSRYAGPVNINMIFDEEVWQALCDEQFATGVTKYDAGMVKMLYEKLLLKRTPKGIPAEDDLPFKSLATGVIPANDPQTGKFKSGLKDTILCADNPLTFDGSGGPTQIRLFQVHLGAGEGHPYRQYELLTKIYNNLTVRSNTFAVFVTVGFFEVTDDSTVPVKLGAEIGKAEGRHVRHRMFAIVDRTQLAAVRPTFAKMVTAVNYRKLNSADPSSAELLPGLVGINASSTSVTVPAATGGSAPTGGYTLDLKPGLTVQVDNGAAAERVVLQPDPTGMFPFKAYFNMPHPVDAPVSIVGPELAGPGLTGTVLGNPGVNPALWANNYPAPVLYYTVIEGK